MLLEAYRIRGFQNQSGPFLSLTAGSTSPIEKQFQQLKEDGGPHETVY
jgi:hypothetical protein